MKLIITRHGETEWNLARRWQGRTDIGLTCKGREQAHRLAERLKEHNIGRIYSSPLKRALQTAKAIHKYHPQAELVIEDDLKEMNFGIFEGLTHEQIQDKYPDVWNKRQQDKWHYRIPKGESYADTATRAWKVLDKVLQTEKDSLIVAHGTLNKVLFMRLMDKPLEEITLHRQVNAGISIFTIKQGKVSVDAFNCGRHLGLE